MNPPETGMVVPGGPSLDPSGALAHSSLGDNAARHRRLPSAL